MAAPKSEITISVILSTYNHPKWLEKVLWGYEMQTYKHFEIIIADDGSGQETKALIDKFKSDGLLKITHVWHPDNGFQKTAILNKAILASQSDYLIFSDGDCIPKDDFVETHATHRKPSCFVSGGYFKLPMATSKLIDKKAIEAQAPFDKKWLLANGVPASFKLNKISSGGLKEKFLNWVTPTKATWNGHNSSGWKKDILAVKGFDERMKYGGEDREMGERLMNMGVKPLQRRYSAICVHLDHARGYVSKEAWELNNAIRKETKRSGATVTNYGLQ